MIFYDQLKQAAIARGALWLEKRFQLNLVGIRNTVDTRSNEFNDLICVAFLGSGGGKNVLVCAATTDPGIYWRENLANVAGTAILKEGYHPKIWKIGKHQGKYHALVQASPVTVWRDNNKDSVLDLGVSEQTGHFGINLHRAGEFNTSNLVDKWSAGCQVMASPSQFSEFMRLADEHELRYGNSFDYTLLRDTDVKNVPGAGTS